jgi:hypothetical protein
MRTRTNADAVRESRERRLGRRKDGQPRRSYVTELQAALEEIEKLRATLAEVREARDVALADLEKACDDRDLFLAALHHEWSATTRKEAPNA